MMQTPSKSPWYREPLVWLLIGIPLSSVIFGIFMLQLALNSDDGLVVDDYYQRGKEINRVLKRDRAAATYGLESRLTFDYGTATVSMRLISHGQKVSPPEIRLQFLHATRAGHDREITLLRTADMAYFGLLPRDIVAGRFDLELEADDWRLVATMRLPADNELVIKSAYSAQ